MVDMVVERERETTPEKMVRVDLILKSETRATCGAWGMRSIVEIDNKWTCFNYNFSKSILLYQFKHVLFVQNNSIHKYI